MPSPVSRRAWLRTTSLGVGAGLILPAALPAEALAEAAWPRASRDELEGYARDVAARRAANGPVRLASNENPFGMSPRAKQAMFDAYDEHNKYGSPAYDVLKRTFAKQAGVPADHVMVTQGSREVLCVAALAHGIRGADMLAADPTFEALPEYATHMGLRVHRVPLDANHAHDLDAMDRRLTGSIGLVFVCNPNNPTGTLVADGRLRDFVKGAAARTTVLVDEAYHDFVTDPGYRTMTDLVLEGRNVIVLRTASKIHGLAGCRIGFAIARPDIIARMQGFTTGVPNALAARAAIAAIADTEWQRFCVQKNTEGQAILRAAITQLGRKQTETHTNFAFFHAGRPVADVHKACESRGYLIGRAFPPYNDWVRVSIGTPEEMQAFVKVLPDVLRA
jgi:histidinol-phosphate aminotransferase